MTLDFTRPGSPKVYLTLREHHDSLSELYPEEEVLRLQSETSDSNSEIELLERSMSFENEQGCF